MMMHGLANFKNSVKYNIKIVTLYLTKEHTPRIS